MAYHKQGELAERSNQDLENGSWSKYSAYLSRHVEHQTSKLI